MEEIKKYKVNPSVDLSPSMGQILKKMPILEQIRKKSLKVKAIKTGENTYRVIWALFLKKKTYKETLDIAVVSEGKAYEVDFLSETDFKIMSPSKLLKRYCRLFVIWGFAQQLIKDK
jgi:hypothetical protein